MSKRSETSGANFMVSLAAILEGSSKIADRELTDTTLNLNVCQALIRRD